MCLYYDARRTRELKASKQKVFTFYKVMKNILDYNNRSCYASPYYGNVTLYVIKNREYKAKFSCQYYDSDFYEGLTLDYGIHVYRSIRAAKKEWGYSSSINRIILECKCLKSDLIAAGDNGEALFKKITFTGKKIEL